MGEMPQRFSSKEKIAGENTKKKIKETRNYFSAPVILVFSDT
jgi:hypothetical protein